MKINEIVNTLKALSDSEFSKFQDKIAIAEKMGQTLHPTIKEAIKIVISLKKAA